MIIHVYDMFTRRQDRKAVEAVKDGGGMVFIEGACIRKPCGWLEARRETYASLSPQSPEERVFYFSENRLA